MIRTFDMNKIQEKGDGISQSQNTLTKPNGDISYNTKGLNNHRRILS